MYYFRPGTRTDPENELFLPVLGNPDDQQGPPQPKNNKFTNKITTIIITIPTLLLLFLVIAIVTLTINDNGGVQPINGGSSSPERVSPARGKEGVSEKGNRRGGENNDDVELFPWTNDMLMWQRTGYHFQPQKNWMNDPNGPLYHKGYYHLFYQYNPDSAIWGNITWGHAVSTDMINWKYLPISMVPDQWYDINGVWTGSATILPGGNITMLYTGDTNDYVQVQNLAYPLNLSDPLLLEWVKYPGNPVLTPPEGIGSKDFRDPTTAWMGPDGYWRLAIGSKVNRSGITLIYKTKDFLTYELVGNLHGVPNTGMWECVDFYPVSTTSENGLDTSAYGPGMKHLLKASLDDTREDVYALGRYFIDENKWVPDNPDMDVGIGLRLDYGKYYASKTFYDQNKGRRILWGWVGETDTEFDDLLKGWASLQSIPRVVTYDAKTGTNVLQWPVEELETLRTVNTNFDKIILPPGSLLNLNITSAAQLDIAAEFKIDDVAVKAMVPVGDNVIHKCSSAALRQALGPFGLVVLADDSLMELTPVYFHVAKAFDGTLKHWFCTDQSRSSTASGVNKDIYGGPVPVLDGENYTMRLLVDHSIVEAFGQGGRTCITSRIYPTKAINGAARVFLFNNMTDLTVTASLNVWNLDSAKLVPFN